jgi:hypothetical protein
LRVLIVNWLHLNLLVFETARCKSYGNFPGVLAIEAAGLDLQTNLLVREAAAFIRIPLGRQLKYWKERSRM